MVACDADAEDADFEVGDCGERLGACQNSRTCSNYIVDEQDLFVTERMLGCGGGSEGKDVCYVFLALMGLYCSLRRIVF